MKKLTKVFYFNVPLFILIGCVANIEEPMTNFPENTSVLDVTINEIKETDKNTSISNLEEPNTDDSYHHSSKESKDINLDSTLSENSDLNVEVKKDTETLSQYSSEKIEFARVWLQLGPNKDIDELNVLHIPAGTPLNHDDDTSASYPEDVIQLAGSHLVDGSVTYSGNGDGTINVYNIPLRWDGKYPAGENFYIDIIKNTKLVYVNPRKDEKIVELIKLQK